MLKLRSYVLQLCPRLIDGYTGLESPNSGKIQKAPVVVQLLQHAGKHLIVGSHRYPHIRAAKRGRSLESSWHHADDCESLSVEQNVLADDARIGSEVALPHAVREHYNSGGSRLIFVGTEGAAKRRLNSEHVEVVAGDKLGAKGLRLAVNGHTHARAGKHQHLRKRLRALADILCVRL